MLPAGSVTSRRGDTLGEMLGQLRRELEYLDLAIEALECYRQRVVKAEELHREAERMSGESPIEPPAGG